MLKKTSASLIKMVTILSDGGYHDGDTIGKKLKMTRSAVWKLIKKLEGYHIQLDSVKGKGYALLEPLILLERNKIKQYLADEKVDILIFESMPSTNDYLKTIKNSKSITICLAEQQTHGRGRLGREWYSPFGKNIYMSCLYPFQKDISELAGLSLVTSLAILRTLKEMGVREKIFVKWPNDISYDSKKLSGSLIEIQAETHGTSWAVIGVGMNVNMMDDDHHISQAWTSLRKIIGQYVDRNQLCAKLIQHLIAYWKKFDAQGFAPFIHEWVSSDCLMHQTITLNNLDKKIKGKVMGVNEQGHLLLELADGSMGAFSSGDTSVVKK